jgi:hypothetical protein
LINIIIMIKLLGIKIFDRIKEIGLTQEILSNHSNIITTRLGFHELSEKVCGREGYIILHLTGDPFDSKKLITELNAVGGIEIKEMSFGKDENYRYEYSDEEGLRILGILIEHDKQAVLDVQKLLTSFGCNIKARLGVNESFFGAPVGLIILELTGDIGQKNELENKLNEISKVRVRRFIFN